MKKLLHDLEMNRFFKIGLHGSSDNILITGSLHFNLKLILNSVST